MIRFVTSEQGELLLDHRHRVPGRGAYLHPRRACAELAVKRRAFQSAFGRPVKAPEAETLLAQMRDSLGRRFHERIGLARRAGAVEVGIEPTRRALKLDRALLVVIASDASEGTRQQIRSACERKSVATAELLAGAVLGAALGEDFISAAAVTAEPFAGELRAWSYALENTGTDWGGNV
jgi:predicted RNA-binding protein YlxR (DUF448 family)